MRLVTSLRVGEHSLHPFEGLRRRIEDFLYRGSLDRRLFRDYCERVFTAETRSTQSSEYFLIKISFLRVLCASAVRYPNPFSPRRHRGRRVRRFFIINFFLRGLRASAVQSPSPCTAIALARFATQKPGDPDQKKGEMTCGSARLATDQRQRILNQSYASSPSGAYRRSYSLSIGRPTSNGCRTRSGVLSYPGRTD